MDLQQIKSIDLLGFIQSLTSQHGIRTSKCWMFLSPLRQEKSPSFAVYPETNSFYDFGIGKGGDIINFAMLYRNCTFKEALEWLSGNDYSGLKFYSKQYKLKQDIDSDDKVKEFYGILKGRTKVSWVKSYFQKMGVRYYPEIGAVTYFNKKENSTYVAIPCPNSENPVSLECRLYNGEGNRRLTLFNKSLWIFLRDTSTFLVTESILDCLAGEIILNDNSISLLALNGIGNKGKAINFIKEHQPEKVILALDADEPGKQTEWEIAREIESYTLVFYCTVHKKAGVKDLHKLLKTM